MDRPGKDTRRSIKRKRRGGKRHHREQKKTGEKQITAPETGSQQEAGADLVINISDKVRSVYNEHHSGLIITPGMDDVAAQSRAEDETPGADVVDKFTAPGEQFYSLQRSRCRDRLSKKRRCSENEDRCPKKPFSLDCIQKDGPVSSASVATTNLPILDLMTDSSEDSLIDMYEYDPMSSESEYKILVNFFKKMGYSKEVVEKVIRELGQSEDILKLLDEIEKESNKVPTANIERRQNAKDGNASKLRQEVRSVYNEHHSGLIITPGMDDVAAQSRAEDETPGADVVDKFTAPGEQFYSLQRSRCRDRLSKKRRCSENEDRCPKKPFSLDCIQKDGPVSSASVATTNLPILDLMTDSSEDSLIDMYEYDPMSSESEYKILVNFFKKMGYSKEVVEKVIRELGQSEDILKLLDEIEKESNKVPTANIERRQNAKDGNASKLRQEVMEDLVRTRTAGNEDLGNVMKNNPTATQRLQTQVSGTEDTPGPSNVLPWPQVTKQIPIKCFNSTHPPKPVQSDVKPSASVRPDKYNPPVTGEQIYLNSIKTPYRLELKNEPGRVDLKHIIIDGSNVAFSHGLRKFFSCRGIAIAVEYFWNKGHRNITVFVPHWRTKRDPNITEQHFLQQLEELGILSFTPSRTMLGSQICSHDDRFLLHLAEKTGGIIVTNDNLREFVVESLAWTKIIKERLLQFIFVGDIFMIPDDPLGRHGPNLDNFLSKDRAQVRGLAMSPRVLLPSIRRMRN
ncbi:NEDD4-binding protein 1-like isoform X4 [Ranitomeya variabilis]|uniref:NEDD4-binding protein 1-like isoform X4 n=1 Tax=Ranitomeya variabilis TaxID=490064 RepID=UPI0040566407